MKKNWKYGNSPSSRRNEIFVALQGMDGFPSHRDGICKPNHYAVPTERKIAGVAAFSTKISPRWGVLALLLIVILFVFAACRNKSADQSQHDGMDMKPAEVPAEHDNSDMEMPSGEAVYTCPMHPEIQRNEPGNCPICGMELVKKVPGETTAAPATDSLDFLLKPTYEYVLGSVKTVRPVRKSLTAALEVPGYLAYDARNQLTSLTLHRKRPPGWTGPWPPRK